MLGALAAVAVDEPLLACWILLLLSLLLRVWLAEDPWAIATRLICGSRLFLFEPLSLFDVGSMVKQASLLSELSWEISTPPISEAAPTPLQLLKRPPMCSER